MRSCHRARVARLKTGEGVPRARVLDPLGARLYNRRMFEDARAIYSQALSEIRAAGLYKEERVITTPQGAQIRTTTGQEVLNFCANNYLGLSSHPAVLEAHHAGVPLCVICSVSATRSWWVAGGA